MLFVEVTTVQLVCCLSFAFRFLFIFFFFFLFLRFLSSLHFFFFSQLFFLLFYFIPALMVVSAR